jgi:hypothetical protein
MESPTKRNAGEQRNTVLLTTRCQPLVFLSLRLRYTTRTLSTMQAAAIRPHCISPDRIYY